MILHLGSDCFVKIANILMILDYKEAVKNQDTSLFLEGCDQQYVCNTEKPKAVIVTKEDGGQTVYISPISPRTLLKRCAIKELRLLLQEV